MGFFGFIITIVTNIRAACIIYPKREHSEIFHYAEPSSMHSSTTPPHAKSAMTNKSAIKRLLRDLQEVIAHESFTVTAHPVGDDLKLWCGNMKGYGPYAGMIFHFTLKFGDDYPNQPPEFYFHCKTLDGHPNVFNTSRSAYPFVCLDMLRKSNSIGMAYSGWSPAYSALGLIMQIRSFIFGTSVEQDDNNHKHSLDVHARGVDATKKELEAFKCPFCDHTGRKPSPEFKADTFSLSDNYFPPLGKEKEEVVPCGIDLLAKIPEDIIVAIAYILSHDGLSRFEKVDRRTRGICGNNLVWHIKELTCFHSKENFGDDPTLILGVPLQIERHPDGKLKALTSSLNPLSKSVWESKGIVVLDVDRSRIDEWLPMILNPNRDTKILFDTTVRIMTNTTLDRSKVPIHVQVHSVLKMFTNLMNTMAVKLNLEDKNNTYISDRAIYGYGLFHYMLLKLTEQMPCIAHEAERRVQKFMAGKCNKHEIPDLGEFLCYLTLSDTPWHTIATTFLEELFARQIRWIAQKFPEVLDTNISDATRLAVTLDGASTSLKLVMFQVEFLRQYGRPVGKSCRQLIHKYDNCMGVISHQERREFQDACKRIYNSSTWKEFFKGIQVAEPSPSYLAGILRRAMLRSATQKYHGQTRRGGKGAARSYR